MKKEKDHDPADLLRSIAVMIEKHNSLMPDTIDTKAAMGALLLIAATRVISELPGLAKSKILATTHEQQVMDRAAKDAAAAVVNVNKLANGALGWLRAINPQVAAAAAEAVQAAVDNAGWNPRVRRATEASIKH